MRTFQHSLIAGLAACSLALAGCGPRPATDTAIAPSAAGGDAHDHDHPHEGPHHGTLVELGDEEYHAEVVHDASSVTVYMLGSNGKDLVPIDAESLTINLIQAAVPKQFTLTASPEETDPAGKSSRFTTKDAELVGHLDDASAAAKLSVTIAGTSFQGEISHDHDHAGHDHAH